MNRPTLWHRMCAAMTGEIPADTLEAYRRASLAVYDALSHCDSHRLSAKEQGRNAWTLAPATQAEILCTWNAFVLQTLGDSLLDADYRNDPSTRGFVPEVTADQILRFYGQVEGWLNRAQQAHYNPDYSLDLGVPAELPTWSEAAERPEIHLKGMLDALNVVRNHSEAALTFLNESPPQNEQQRKGLNIIRQLQAAATTKARYAGDMMTDEPTPEVYLRVEEHVKTAIEGFYLLGQLLAMPDLVHTLNLTTSPDNGMPVNAASSSQSPTSQQPGAPELPAPPYYTPAPALFKSAPQRPLLPGEPGFDIWCLTDPDAVAYFSSDVDAVGALEMLWMLDPDPAATIEIQSEIDAALQRGDIAYATDRYGKKLGHFYCRPWGAVYIAYRSVTIAGRRLHVMEQFIFYVSCDGINAGEPFIREIVTGNFVPTAKFEYGNPIDTLEY